MICTMKLLDDPEEDTNNGEKTGEAEKDHYRDADG